MPVINSVIKGAGGGGDVVEAVIPSIDFGNYVEGDKVLLNESVTRFREAFSTKNGTYATISTTKYVTNFNVGAKRVTNAQYYATLNNQRTYDVYSWGGNPNYYRNCYDDLNWDIGGTDNMGSQYTQTVNYALFENNLPANGFSMRTPSSDSEDACLVSPFDDYIFGNQDVYKIVNNVRMSFGSFPTQVNGYAFINSGVVYVLCLADANNKISGLYRIEESSIETVWTSDIASPITKNSLVLPLDREGGTVLVASGVPAQFKVYHVYNIFDPNTLTLSEDKALSDIMNNAHTDTKGSHQRVITVPTKGSNTFVQTRAGSKYEKGQILLQGPYDSSYVSVSTDGYFDTYSTFARYLTFDTNTKQLTYHGSFISKAVVDDMIDNTNYGSGGVLYAPVVSLKHRRFVIPISADGVMSVKRVAYGFDEPTNVSIVAEEPVAGNFSVKSLTGIVSDSNYGTDYFGNQTVRVKTVLDPNNPFSDNQFENPTGLNLTVSQTDSGEADVSVSKGYMKRDGVEYINTDTLEGYALLPSAGDTARERYTITNNVAIASLSTAPAGQSNIGTFVGSGDQTMQAIPSSNGEYAYNNLAFLDQSKQVVTGDEPSPTDDFAIYGTPTTTISCKDSTDFHARAVDKVRIACNMGTSAANYAVLSLPYEYNDVTAAYERVYNVGFVSPDVTGTAYTLPLFKLHDSVNNKDFNVTLSVPTDTANGYTVMVMSDSDTLIGTFAGGDFPPAGVDSYLRLWVRHDGTVTNYIAQVLTSASEHDVTLAGTMSAPMTGDQISYGYVDTDGARPVFLWSGTGVTANKDKTAVSDNLNLFNDISHDIVAEPYLLESGMLTGLWDPYFPSTGLYISTDSEVSTTSVSVSAGRIRQNNMDVSIPQALTVPLSEAIINDTRTLIRGVCLKKVDGSYQPRLTGYIGKPAIVGSMFQLTAAYDRADLTNMYYLNIDKTSGSWNSPKANIRLVGGAEGEVDTADFRCKVYNRYPGESPFDLIKDYGGGNAGLGETKYYEMDLPDLSIKDMKNVCSIYTFLVPGHTLVGEGTLSMNKPMTLVNSKTGNENLVIYMSESSDGSELQIWGTVTKDDNTLINLPVLNYNPIPTKNWYNNVPFSVQVWLNAPVTKNEDGSFATTKNVIRVVPLDSEGYSDYEASTAGEPFVMAAVDRLQLSKHTAGTTPQLPIATVGCGFSWTQESFPSSTAGTTIEAESYTIGAYNVPGSLPVYEATTWEQPVLTSSTGGSIISTGDSAHFQSNEFWQVFKAADPAGKGWQINSVSTSSTYTAYFVVDTPMTVKSFGFTMPSAETAYTPSLVQIYGSTSTTGSNLVLLGELSMVAQAGLQTMYVTNDNFYVYFQVKVTPRNSTSVQLGRLFVDGLAAQRTTPDIPGGPLVVWTRPNLTSATSHGTVTSDRMGTNSVDGWNAFDGNANTSYVVNSTGSPAWIKWVLPEPIYAIAGKSSFTWKGRHDSSEPISAGLVIYGDEDRTVPLTDPLPQISRATYSVPVIYTGIVSVIYAYIANPGNWGGCAELEFNNFYVE